MTAALRQLLPSTATWPAEDQEALLSAALLIEAQRSGRYRASDAELATIDRGLADVRAGEFADASAQASVIAKFQST